MKKTKFYPPIYINYISCEYDRTFVKVSFYDCSVEELKLAAKEGRNANCILKKQEIFELPAMSAEDAREIIYTKLVKEKLVEKIEVPEGEVIL